jgi:hypothetical protein
VYPRHAELRDGTLLVTASVSRVTGPNNLPAFPVFESKDGGVTFQWISNLTDQVNGWGMSAQPALLELRKPLGGFKPGTIFASGNSWSSTGTRIDLYASTDRARTWQFVSHVAEGGRPNTTNGATPVWEPFLLYVCSLPFSCHALRLPFPYALLGYLLVPVFSLLLSAHSSNHPSGDNASRIY